MSRRTSPLRLLHLLAAGCGVALTVPYPLDIAMTWPEITDSAVSTGDSGNTEDSGDTEEPTDSDSPTDTEPPRCADDRSWTQVSAGRFQTCGVHGDGCIECWEVERYNNMYDTAVSFDYGTDEPPDGTFTSVATAPGIFSAGMWHACAIKPDRTVVCWGRNDYGQASAPAGEFIALALTTYFSCGIKADRTLACWGFDTIEATPPAGEGFVHIAGGMREACATHENGTVRCWDASGNYAPLPVTARDAAVWSAASCVVDTNGALACMVVGTGESYVPDGLPEGSDFANVCMGVYGGCAHRVDGTVACWGEDFPTSPEGAFVQVSCGVTYACGLRLNGSISCWGDCAGQCDVPA